MTNILAFKDYYQKEKKEIDQALQVFNMSLKNDNPIIQENIEFFKDLNKDGKNIRGTLVNLGYSLLKEDKESLNLALAYELFQTSILVHDDIIDKDNTRRGKETIHYRNECHYTKDSITNRKHLSNSIALCMGDYGLYLANQIIATSYQKHPNLGKVLEIFNQTILRTIEGELLDVVLPYKSRHKELPLAEIEKTIYEIDLLKTANYTIIGPLTTGLILAGGSEQQQQDITLFGEKIGIAFQIQDDILGIFSDEMGKVKGSDIREYKQTLLFSRILKTIYKKEFLKIYGKDKLTEKNIEEIKELLIKSGSKQYAEDKMREYYQEGLSLLEKMSWIPKEKKQLLTGFVEYLKIRNK